MYILPLISVHDQIFVPFLHIRAPAAGTLFKLKLTPHPKLRVSFLQNFLHCHKGIQPGLLTSVHFIEKENAHSDNYATQNTKKLEVVSSCGVYGSSGSRRDVDWWPELFVLLCWKEVVGSGVLWLVVVNVVVGLKRVACAGNRVVCGRVW